MYFVIGGNATSFKYDCVLKINVLLLLLLLIYIYLSSVNLLASFIFGNRSYCPIHLNNFVQSMDY